MPQLISKLQHKTYEKGEYSDEKIRCLDEVIELIYNFPWTAEQYAEVELTGPSITIENEFDNYLKIGIYYGGKFSVYYINSNFYYYEVFNVTIDVALTKLKEFYSGQVDLTAFDKSQYAVNLKSYFKTKPFRYQIKFLKVILLMGTWNYLFGLFTVFFIAALITKPTIYVLLLLVPILGLGGLIAYILSKYYKVRNQYLKISRGNDCFLFSNISNEIKQYNKNEINSIVHYMPHGVRSPNNFELFKITFKDNSVIMFSNMLISATDLSSKFSDKWKLDMINKPLRLFEMMQKLNATK